MAGVSQVPPPSSTPPVVETQIVCPQCGYNLTGVAIGSACPECGLVIGRGMFSAATSLPTSGMAVGALVLGILSIIGCTLYGIPSVPCGIVAMVLASKVKGQIIRNEVAPASAGLANAGWVCGLIGLCLGGLGMGLLVIVILSAMYG